MRINLKVLLALLLIPPLTGCVSQGALVESGKIYKGMSKNQIEGLNYLTNQFQHPFAITATRIYDDDAQIEIISPADGSIVFLFTQVTTPSNPSLLTAHAGNGYLHSWYDTIKDARQAARSLGVRSDSSKRSGDASSRRQTSNTGGMSQKPNPNSDLRSITEGNGFFINQQGQFVTSLDLVEACTRGVNIRFGSDFVAADLIAEDSFYGLALLDANVTNKSYLKLADRPADVGQRTIAAAYGSGAAELSLNYRTISAITGQNNDSTRLKIDRQLDHRTVGSPLLDRNSGEIVAMMILTSHTMSISGEVEYGVKASSVTFFLESNQLQTLQHSPLPSWTPGTPNRKYLSDSIVYVSCNGNQENAFHFNIHSNNPYVAIRRHAQAD